jgi:hypothetical protein
VRHTSLTDTAEQLRKQVSDAISEYVEKHPQAADAAEGIATWWLGERRHGVSLALLQEVLEDLVRDGRLRRIVTPDGGSLYTNVKNAAKPIGRDP